MGLLATSGSMTIVHGLILCVAFVAFLATRLAPSLLAKVDGVDAWYHLICAREMRRQRRISPDLRAYFVFEPSTRYPPVFGALLSLVPESFLRRHLVWVGVGIDAIQFLILYLLSASLLGPRRGLVACAIYAIHPTLGLEYSTLNPRSLASLLVTAFFLTVMASNPTFQPMLIGLGAFLVALILLTNKLATQLLAVAFCLLAIGQPRILLLAVAGPMLALLLSWGHYAEVLKGHWAILAFWRKRIAHVGAHQILESVPYFQSGFRSTRFYPGGVAGAFQLARRILAHDPFLPFVFLTLISSPGAIQPHWLVWLASVYLCALGTALLPPLRFLGEGYRYLKFAAFPEAYLLARSAEPWLLIPPALVSLYVAWRLRGSRVAETGGSGFRSLVDQLASDSGAFATFPTSLANRLAFETSRPLLWGGHSSGYEHLDSWLPVLRERIEELMRAEGVSQLVLDTRFVSPALLGAAFTLTGTFGDYQTFRRRDEPPSDVLS